MNTIHSLQFSSNIIISRPTLPLQDIKSNKGCTNDKVFQEGWLHDELKGRMFHETSDSCCKMFFPQGNCQVVEACGSSDTEPDAPVLPKCISHGWHVVSSTSFRVFSVSFVAIV